MYCQGWVALPLVGACLAVEGRRSRGSIRGQPKQGSAATTTAKQRLQVRGPDWTPSQGHAAAGANSPQRSRKPQGVQPECSHAVLHCSRWNRTDLRSANRPPGRPVSRRSCYALLFILSESSESFANIGRLQTVLSAACMVLSEMAESFCEH